MFSYIVLISIMLNNSRFPLDIGLSYPIIELQQGLIKGKMEQTYLGVPYYSFSGIPYAEPPVGELRFKDPIPASSWEGVRDGTVESEIPAQYNTDTLDYFGVDDCLYLNVYTPRLKRLKNNLLPVVVYLFGGGMVSGNSSATHFKPYNFMEENVVFVNLNYRLGVMGFLCTDSVNARGDMGLKDQIMALKWVKDNIEVFNGDPNKVTLMGCSSGSAMVDLHILSPMSKGLFHKTIMQSGSVMNFWTRSLNAIKYAERMALYLGYNKNGNETLFNFLNKFDTKTLVMASARIINTVDHKMMQIFAFVPVINKFKDYDGFLNEEPHKILAKGDYNKVDILSGVTNYEGHDTIKPYAKRLSNLHFDNLKQLVPEYLNVNFKGFDNMFNTIYRGSPSKYGLPTNIVNFFTDLVIHSGVFYSLHERLKHNFTKEYFYYYKYNIYKDNPEIRGADHASENILIGNIMNPKMFSPTDLLVKNYFSKMWGNFAKTGNPTPQSTDVIKVKWLPITKDKFQYLTLDVNLKMSTVLNTKRRFLWRKIYKHIRL